MLFAECEEEILNSSSTGMKDIQRKVSPERLSARGGQDFPELCYCGKLSSTEEKHRIHLYYFLLHKFR